MILQASLLLYTLTKVLSLLNKGIYSDSMNPDSIPVCKRAYGLQPTGICVTTQVK